MISLSFFAYLLLIIVNICSSELHKGGVLFPRDSETREVISLDGIWKFSLQNSSAQSDVHLMPVPSSYNDITTDWKLRDHVGIVVYERNFYVPKFWPASERIWLRFGSVSYSASVYVNGELVMTHKVGHLPFLAEVTNFVKTGTENYIKVECDNVLTNETIPQGYLETLESNRKVQRYSFDFYNYAGIDRPVKLYTTPLIYIDDIAIQTELKEGGSAALHYNVTVLGNDTTIKCNVTLLDKDGNLVANSGSIPETSGVLTVDKPNLWWPYLMDPNPGYLYKLMVVLHNTTGELIDKYVLPVGLRTVSWTDSSLLVNNRPIFLHGFGRHEDSDIRGKGLDLPLIIRDYNLIKWIGANAFRTSHYPYAEEIMDMADEVGIMIIDEVPSVNTEFFFDALLDNHKQAFTELIRRDKNRPSVIIWSAANEPKTQFPQAKEYFRKVIEHVKTLDTSRPTTIVEFQTFDKTESSEFVDIVSFNRYNGWYQGPGDLDVIVDKLVAEANEWRNKFKKPVMLMEYGADTIEGLHILPDYIWSEEYQVDMMSKNFEAFDQLRKTNFFVGEFIWNFADFKTAQDYKRAGGNRKGIFTRNRQPKQSAFHLRRRYWGLAHEYYNVSLPEDLVPYTTESQKNSKTEL